MFMHAALHGVEACLVSQSSLTKLRRSRRLPLANTGALLSLLDGLVDGDTGFHVVRSRFRMIRRFLAYQLGETGRINHMLHHVSLGCVSHATIHLLVKSQGLIGQYLDTDFLVCEKRSCLPKMGNIAGQIHNF